MNRISRITAIALSLAAAGSAFAESPEVLSPQPAVSMLSRAEVRAELLQARAAGTLRSTEADFNRQDSIVSTRSRADVQAETLAAIASGEVRAGSHESNAFGAAFDASQGNRVSIRMARTGR